MWLRTYPGTPRPAPQASAPPNGRRAPDAPACSEAPTAPQPLLLNPPTSSPAEPRQATRYRWAHNSSRSTPLAFTFGHLTPLDHLRTSSIDDHRLPRNQDAPARAKPRRTRAEVLTGVGAASEARTRARLAYLESELAEIRAEDIDEPLSAGAQGPGAT